MLKPAFTRALAPVAAAALALGACAPFLSPIGNPWSPSSASANSANASSAEVAARASVPVANSTVQAAQVAEMIPGVAAPAVMIEKFAAGYAAEMTRQITGLEERLQASIKDPSRVPPDKSDWLWAIGLATAAGGANVFSFRQGQKNSSKGAAQ